MKTVDLRSDTHTRPSPAMRQAMAEAEVGDDVYGEDPTVNALEAHIAARLGHEAALFVTSGTQSNLAALLSHCGRGDEYIAGRSSHTYAFEGGGAAALGGIQPCPIPFEADGTLDLEAVAAAVKPDDPHFPQTRLLCLENTQSGKPSGPEYAAAARALCDTHDLKLHLDGARLFNAAQALAVDPKAIAAPFDSVSVCLSKGLGAPAGSLLCGPTEFIRTARRWRKTLGGGMRQAGILAAGGLYALEHNVERLVEDHRRAAGLAEALNSIQALAGRVSQATNMLFLDLDTDTVGGLRAHLAAEAIVISGSRWVMHLDIDDGDVERVIDAVKRYL